MYLSKPSERTALAHIERQRHLPYSYTEVGHSQHDVSVDGFDNDFNHCEIGRGEADWEAAKAAIRAWRMFPGGWACIHPTHTPIRVGETVAMSARVWGFWWLNACRIVYVIDEKNRFGFAYGTLPGHAECGEEIFMVERHEDDSVHYVIKAFSRPRLWLARLGYPIARAQQRKFVRDSKAAMQQWVKNAR
jgi:uncharacterized protein (UPF0548 family)